MQVSSSSIPTDPRVEPKATLAPGQWRDPSQILRQLIDLFVSRPVPAAMDILRFEEIATGLLARADAATLAYAAARLATHPCAPASVLDALVEASPICAKILAEHCSRLSPAPILAFAEGDNPGLAAAVARRRGLTGALVAALAARPEAEVLRALAGNCDIELSAATLTKLTAAARGDMELARLLLARSGDSGLQETLFLAADAATRRIVLAHIERQSFTAEDIRAVRTAGPALIAWMMRKNPVADSFRFAQEMARLTGLPNAGALALIEDEAGDGLALLFAATAVPPDVATRLFLRCRPAISHSLERIRALRQIVETIPAYGARKLAHRIATGTPATAQSRPARYQSLHDVAAAQLPARAGGAHRAKKRPRSFANNDAPISTIDQRAFR